MKKIILLTALLALSFVLIGQTIQEKTLFYGKKITGIDVSNSFTAKVLLGDENYVKLEYDPIYDQYIDIELTDGIVKIALKKNNIITKSKTMLNAVICVSDLTEVTASGSADVYFIGNYTPKNIKIKAMSSSDLYGLNCKTDNYNLEISASSDVADFIVDAKNVMIKTSASSDIKNIDIKSEKAQLESSGASDISKANIDIADALIIKLSGSSDIKDVNITSKEAIFSISGACDFINSNISINENFSLNISGSSSVSNAKIASKNMSVVATGASDFIKSTLHCIDMSMTASGSSTCSLTGKVVTAVVTASGVSDVKMKDFEISNLVVTLNSSCFGEFKANNTLSYSIKSNSNLCIYGNPLIKQGEGANVKFIK